MNQSLRPREGESKSAANFDYGVGHALEALDTDTLTDALQEVINCLRHSPTPGNLHLLSDQIEYLYRLVDERLDEQEVKNEIMYACVLFNFKIYTLLDLNHKGILDKNYQSIYLLVFISMFISLLMSIRSLLLLDHPEMGRLRYLRQQMMNEANAIRSSQKTNL